MSKVCFLDNDILVKLVACNLFDKAISILDIDRSNLIVLPSARHYFKRSKSAKRKYPENIRLKVTEIANGCKTVNPSTQDAISEVEILQKYENIDNGEALLVAATREEEYFWLTTGDKRFLRALTNSELDLIVSRLQGRVICLEQLIRQLIYVKGFEEILINVLPARKYDKSLETIFGSGEKSTRDNVLYSLESYIEDLRKDTKEILRNIW